MQFGFFSAYSNFQEVLIIKVVFNGLLMFLETEAVLVVELRDLSEPVANALQECDLLRNTAPH